MKKSIILGITVFIIGISNLTNAKKITKNKDEIEYLIEAWQKALKIRMNYKFEPINFDPFKTIKLRLKPAPISNNITVYLKAYNLSELRLVGIVKINNKHIAIIEDPQGRGVFLKEGDYLGKNGSIITKITDCAVYICQRYVNEKGTIIISSKPIILSLSKEGKQCSNNL